MDDQAQKAPSRSFLYRHHCQSLVQIYSFPCLYRPDLKYKWVLDRLQVGSYEFYLYAGAIGVYIL